MAYYDLKTNEIWADSNIAGFHDENIEIDEVIAPLIRELNIKGYKTMFCCSGHPFYSLCEAMVDSEETAKAFVGLIGTERTENPRVPIRALWRTSFNDNGNIGSRRKSQNLYPSKSRSGNIYEKRGVLWYGQYSWI